MPLFELDSDSAPPRKLSKQIFDTERELQALVEDNLDDFFKITFVDSEVTTSSRHGGRIDTLGIDQNASPVVLEYKKDKARDIINQGLFYLDWLVDHQGDFQVLVDERLGDPPDEIQWERPRVILIANTFTKYDRYAVRRMGENIELKEYTLYEDGLIEFEDLYSPVSLSETVAESNEDVTLTIDYHLRGEAQGITSVDEDVKNVFHDLRDFMLDFEDVSEVPLKVYIAYKATTNFCCVEIQKSQLKLHLGLDPDEVDDPLDLTRDVSEKGHFGTGDVEVKVEPGDNLEPVKELIEQAYRDNS